MAQQHPIELTRPVSPQLDEILGKPISVLDTGFVRVVDYMGNDAAIVQAARVSYGAGTKNVNEDRGLIRYLMRHRHTTPFEMCEIKLHVRTPMDVWRQWIRHRTANVNEYSTRYSVAIDAAQSTPADRWRIQSTTNRQGSTGFLEEDTGRKLTEQEAQLQSFCRQAYEQRLEAGVAREQARKDLPLSTFTEAYWKIDLHNLLHFLELRMDSHAQQEIRDYANTIGRQIVSRWCPIAWEAFLDYRLKAQSFSATELNILTHLLSGDTASLRDAAEKQGWYAEKTPNLKSRERDEFVDKLRRLGREWPL